MKIKRPARSRNVSNLTAMLGGLAMLFSISNGVFAQFAEWKHSGSIYLLTTPEGANLPATATVKDFPILVRLHQEHFPFDEAQPEGEDIRFSADGTPLAFEIEDWNKDAGVAGIWVRMPMITGNARQEINIHWGKTGAASASDGKAVFNASNGYIGVWHMGREVRDATGNLNSEDKGTTKAAGIIGGARHFPGKKGIFCGDDIQVLPEGGAPHSTQAWFKPEMANGRIVSWGLEKGQGKVQMWYRSPPRIRMDCYFSNGDVRAEIPGPAKGWIHVVNTYENGQALLYINGEKQGEGNPRHRALSIERPARLWIGGWYNHYDFVGDMDEIRISGAARSPAWVRLEYENQKVMQTLVGPVVQEGKTFSVSPDRATMDEGKTMTFTAKAGGAQKVYWIAKDGEQETIVSVDRFTYTLDAGRVTGDHASTLQFKAVYGQTLKTIDIPLTVQESIPEPVFTLKGPRHWDGRQTIEVLPQITNLKQMQAKAAGKLKYEWQVSGLATLNRIEPDKLILERAQNSGTVTITATISNGGAGVSASTTIKVKEPNYDPWVVRTPGKDEKPRDGQFYARDDQNQGTAYCNGTLPQAADMVHLKLYADGKLINTLKQAPGKGGRYAFAVKLKPGLIRYKIELTAQSGSNETIIHQADDLLCGDAYIIEGQSNALATDTRDESPAVPHEWIRSYAYPTDSKTPAGNLWCNPVWKFAGGKDRAASREKHKAVLGWWGMELGKRLVQRQRVPICIFNGAAGGTRIDQHQRNQANPTDPESIYGRLLWRLQEAKLTHGIRAVLWHQGENDQGAAGPDGGYGWETYQRYFVNMTADWKRDFPNIRHYYLFQIWPNACSMGQGNGDMLREKQRSLDPLYSNLEILSTLGINPGGGCHYPLKGWSKFADLVLPLIERDLYARDPIRFMTAPNLKRAYYTAKNRDSIALEFDQPVVWDEALVSQFYLDDEADQVASGSADGSVITLKLKAASDATNITYLKETKWSQETLLLGQNGLAALTFCKVPISALPSPETSRDAYAYKTDSLASRPAPRPFSHMWRLWMKRHNDLANGLTKQKKVDLLVVGDSILFRFERAGQKVWKDYYEKRNGYNFASSGDRTEHVLWRLRNGRLDTIKPKLVMLLIGTNNNGRPDESPEQTAYAIKAITQEIKSRLPTAKILLLGIFPRGHAVDDRARLRNDKVNAIISKLHDNRKIFYLDIGSTFLNPDQTLNKELISDTVHPNAKGFEAWAEAMEPTIKKLMNEH